MSPVFVEFDDVLMVLRLARGYDRPRGLLNWRELGEESFGIFRFGSGWCVYRETVRYLLAENDFYVVKFTCVVGS